MIMGLHLRGRVRRRRDLNKSPLQQAGEVEDVAVAVGAGAEIV